MVAGADDAQRARLPTREDVVRLAGRLNELGARYALIGGIAMAFHGYARATQDLNLLVDPGEDNISLVREALSIFEDNAAAELELGDVAEHGVVRIVDEIVVDLLGVACGVRLRDVEAEVEGFELEGITIPVLGPRALVRTKQTVREKDAIDVQFLRGLLDDPSRYPPKPELRQNRARIAPPRSRWSPYAR